MVSDDGPVTRARYNIEAGVAFWTGAIMGGIAGLIAASLRTTDGVAVGIGWGVAVAVVVWVGALVLANLVTTTIETQATHRCCIQCRHAVKSL